MIHQTPRSSRAGFTLVELLIVLAIAVLVITLGVPNLLDLLARQRLEGQARDLAALAHRARQEALTRGMPAVVEIDGRAFRAFADLHGATLAAPPDGLFNPLSGAPLQGTDFEIGRRQLHAKLALAGPDSQTNIDGFTVVDGVRKAIFEPDGSIRATGAIRLADHRGNYLELRVAPRATGKVGLYKWDGSAWRANGEGGTSWTWH
jgi:type IV fimbrial biogenesis protein FimT